MEIDLNVTSDLRSRGFRITAVRKQLIATLTKGKYPLAISELATLLSDININPNKTTLYREVVFLVDQGIVQEIDLGDGKKRYEISLKGHHHHLICISCQKIADFELGQDLDLQEKKIELQTQFKVVNHALEFFGVCVGCQRLR